MRLLMLTKYGRAGASSRMRSYQYVPFLEASGWQIKISPLFSDDYIAALYSKRSKLWLVLKGYCKRFIQLLFIWRYDLVWIEKEVFPFFPSLPERILKLIGKPYVADYDDALFHRYDHHKLFIIRFLLGKKIDKVMKYSSAVIAGNDYLAGRAKTAGAKKVEIVPTVIDLDKYKISKNKTGKKISAGWIGSPSTSKYLKDLSEAINYIQKKYSVKFTAVGANPDDVKTFKADVLPWSEDSEVKAIQTFDIGIMPLPDEPWERGKCGYKLIQYMACGLPVIASPVGVNTKIINNGSNGFLAQSEVEWQTAFEKLVKNEKLRIKLGLNGRKIVEKEYSLQVQAPRLEKILRNSVKA